MSDSSKPKAKATGKKPAHRPVTVGATKHVHLLMPPELIERLEKRCREIPPRGISMAEAFRRGAELFLAQTAAHHGSFTNVGIFASRS